MATKGKDLNGDGVDPRGYHVLVSVPPLCPADDWKRLAELVLEGTGVGGVYLANKSVLSMYGGGRTTGTAFFCPTRNYSRTVWSWRIEISSLNHPFVRPLGTGKVVKIHFSTLQ